MSVMNAYKDWARIYDSNENPTRDLDRTVLPQLLTDIKHKYIVEAGCGTGKNTKWFATQARMVTAFDLSEHMLKLAREKLHTKNVEFRIHDIMQRWPVSDNSADIVSINLVLEHLPAIDFPIQEAYRVLTPSGILCICELHPEKRISGSQAKYQNTVTGKEIRVDSYLHTSQEYFDSGKKAGFEKIDIRDWYDAKDHNIPRLISALLYK